MKMRLLKTALLASAILAVLVGTAGAVDLFEPDAICRWLFINGRWVLVCM